MNSEKEKYTIAEVANILQCNPAYVYRSVAIAKLKSSNGFIFREELEKFIKEYKKIKVNNE